MPKFKLFLLMIAAVLVSTGCTLSLNPTKVDDKTNGGVFRSLDHGQTWLQKVAVPSTDGKLLSIAGLKIYTMTMDPSDNKALYLGMFERGIIYSYDSAESWTPVRSNLIANQNIIDLAIDPKDKCQIYVSIGSKLLKTNDCARTWQVSYTSANPNVIIRSIAIDHYDSSKIWFGTDNGNLIQSEDHGTSWQNAQIFKNEIRRIVFNGIDSRIILVGLSNGSLHRTLDGGATWTDISATLKSFKGDKSLRDLVIIPSQKDGFLLALRYGLLKTVNNGDDWTEIKLLTPKQPVSINSLAVNYKNPSLIYYVTDNTFYHTQDGGENWSTTPVPTARHAWKILVDPMQDGLVYMAVRE